MSEVDDRGLYVGQHRAFVSPEMETSAPVPVTELALYQPFGQSPGLKNLLRARLSEAG